MNKSRSQNPRKKASGCTCVADIPSHVSVLESVVVELYDQQIHPTQSEVRRKLEKTGVCKAFLASFAAQAATWSKFVVKDSMILLRNSPIGFTDFICPNSLDIPYSMSAFDHTVSYLLEQAKQETVYPKGGRYLMAVELQKRGPEPLRQMTLGALCHMIQRLLNEGILAYENNCIKPIIACASLSVALWTRTQSGVADKSSVPGDDCLAQLKKNIAAVVSKNPAGIVLSQFRSQFTSDYGHDLNFMQFGYTKLATFLESEMQDTVSLNWVTPYNALVVPATGGAAKSIDRQPRSTFEKKTSTVVRNYLLQGSWSAPTKSISMIHGMEYASHWSSTTDVHVKDDLWSKTDTGGESTTDAEDDCSSGLSSDGRMTSLEWEIYQDFGSHEVPSEDVEFVIA